MNLPKPNKINAEKYVAGLSLYKRKAVKIKLSANESALGLGPNADSFAESFILAVFCLNKLNPATYFSALIFFGFGKLILF